MSSVNELRRELELAQKALDIERSLFAKQQQTPSRGDAALRFLRQGLTFGLADEIEAAYEGVKGFATTPGGFSERTEAAGIAADTSMTQSEALRLAARRAFPKTAGGAEMLGGAAIGGSSFALLNNTLRGLPYIARVPGIGATEGALYGAGTARPGERGAGALGGAAIGGVGTPFALGATSTAMGVLRPAARKLGEGLFGTPRDRAVKEVLRAMDADEINPVEAATLLRQMGRNAILPDLGDTLSRLGRAVTSELGPTASQARRFLDARQSIANMELRQVARRAAGASNFDRGIVEIINNAETAAKPIYDEVFSEVIDVTPTMLSLLKRPALQSARRKAEVILRNEGFSTEIIDDVTDVRYMDAVKRALDDQIGVAQRAGAGNRVRVLSDLKRQFVSEIDTQVPRYAEARQVFAGEQAIREAADYGNNMLRGNRRVSDIRETLASMSDSEIQAARAGFLDWLADEIANQSVRRNTVAMKFTDVPKFRETVQLLFPSRDAVDEFLNKAASLSRFRETKNTIIGGSPTARIQSDRGSLEPGLLRVASDSAFSQLNGIASALRLIRGNTQLSQDVIEEIGNILFDPNITGQSLRRGILPRLFDIPTTPPVIAAGATGGAVGSQVDPVLSLLGQR